MHAAKSRVVQTRGRRLGRPQAHVFCASLSAANSKHGRLIPDEMQHNAGQQRTNQEGGGNGGGNDCKLKTVALSLLCSLNGSFKGAKTALTPATVLVLRRSCSFKACLVFRFRRLSDFEQQLLSYEINDTQSNQPVVALRFQTRCPPLQKQRGVGALKARVIGCQRSVALIGCFFLGP